MHHWKKSKNSELIGRKYFYQYCRGECVDKTTFFLFISVWENFLDHLQMIFLSVDYRMDAYLSEIKDPFCDKHNQKMAFNSIWPLSPLAARKLDKLTFSLKTKRGQCQHPLS